MIGERDLSEFSPEILKERINSFFLENLPQPAKPFPKEVSELGSLSDDFLPLTSNREFADFFELSCPQDFKTLVSNLWALFPKNVEDIFLKGTIDSLYVDGKRNQSCGITIVVGQIEDDGENPVRPKKIFESRYVISLSPAGERAMDTLQKDKRLQRDYADLAQARLDGPDDRDEYTRY